MICGKHGVPIGEIGNELYHILSGFINNELVRRKFVCAPTQYENEGRY